MRLIGEDHRPPRTVVHACAQAHGLTGGTLVRGYLMRGTLARLPTLAALVLGNVLGGVVLVELVFSWQGMGQWLLRGLLTRDYPVVQAGVVISALVFTLAYLVADIVQAALEPLAASGRGRVIITSSITAEAAADLGVQVGQQVTAIVKASSVMLGIEE